MPSLETCPGRGVVQAGGRQGDEEEGKPRGKKKGKGRGRERKKGGARQRKGKWKGEKASFSFWWKQGGGVTGKQWWRTGPVSK